MEGSFIERSPLEILTGRWIGVVSLIMTIISCSGYYTVLIHTRDAPDRNKSLLNSKLRASFSVIAILYNFLIHFPKVIRFIGGWDFPLVYCKFEAFMSEIFVFVTIWILNFTTIFKYLCVFHLKNPTAVKEGFWNMFLTLWSIMFSVVIVVSSAVLDEEWPVRTYLCAGEYPPEASLTSKSIKFRMPLIYGMIFSLVIRGVSFCRISWYKLTRSEHLTKHRKVRKAIQYFCSYSILVLSFLGCLASVVHSGMTPFDQMNTYPNFIGRQLLSLILPQLIHIFIITVFFFKKTSMIATTAEILRLRSRPI